MIPGRRGLGCLLLLASSFLACQSGDTTGPGNEPSNTVSASIPPTGGGLLSSDGILRIQVPSGSFPKSVTLRIETLMAPQNADSLAPAQYRVTASDSLPSLPVTVTWNLGLLATTEAHLYGASFTWLARAGESGRRPLNEQRLRLDAVLDEITLQARVDTLDLLVQRVIDASFRASLGPVPASGVVGQGFALNANAIQEARSKIDATLSFVDRLAETPQPAPLQRSGPARKELGTLHAGSASEIAQVAAEYQWTLATSGRFWAELLLSPLSLAQASVDGGWTMEVFAPVFARQAAAADSVFTVSTSDPQGLFVIPENWGAPSSAVGVCGSSGVPLIDSGDGRLVDDHFLGVSGTLGGIGLGNEDATAPAPAEVVHALFLYGAGGATLSRHDATQGWSPAVPVETGRDVSDAAPYRDEPASGGVCYAMNAANAVGFLEYDAQAADYGVSPLRISGNDLPEAPGPVRSAFRRDWGGDVLILCDGEPGALYLWDAATANATKIAEVGNEPAQVRALGDVVVVTDFASQNLLCFDWPQGGTPTLAARVTHGAGARALDLRGTQSGVEVISSSFYDDSYQLTVLHPDGTQLSANAFPLPNEAKGPSAAIFLPGRLGMIACFTSDNVVRVSW